MGSYIGILNAQPIRSKSGQNYHAEILPAILPIQDFIYPNTGIRFLERQSGSKPGYCVELFLDTQTIRVAFIGFWDVKIADAFAVELETAMNQLAASGVRPGEFLYIADFRQSAIQSQMMVERFQQFARDAGTRARRIAVLVSGVLQKMQVQRMATGYDHYRFFLPGEESAAETWLQTGILSGGRADRNGRDQDPLM